MGFSAKLTTSRKGLRSISLPCRSHPSVYRIENVLKMFKTWESTSSLSNPSADIICSGVSQLTELYQCLDELFKTSSTSINENTKWTDELLDASVSFLDILSNTADVLLHTKQQVTDLGCDLRRKGSLSIERIIAKYIIFRKQLRKDIKRSVSSLKKMDNMIYDCPLIMADSENNHHLSSVIRVFGQVSESTIVVLRLLFKFLATPLLKTTPVTSRWTALSRYRSKGKVVPEEKLADTNSNVLQCLDASLFRYSTSYKHEFDRSVQKKIGEFEATVDGICSRVESMSRRLIATRSSLLNLVSFN